MAKARIPNQDVTLQSPEQANRTELIERIETLLGHAKYRLNLLGAFGVLLLGLLVIGAQNVHQLNTQGIAYLLLAKHYAAGEFGLAVSSYWSPLLSWLIALGLKSGWSDPTAARVAQGIAGLLFWTGSLSILFLTKIPIRSLLIGVWLTTLAVLPWSIAYISPDLLAAGLLLLAIGATLFTLRVPSWKTLVLAGIVWGSVYYANAMLLPVVFASLLGFALFGYLGGARPFARSAICQAGIALVLMLPWIGTLKAAYGEWTLGSVWRIDHAVAGPDDINRYHPCFGRFNPPTEGRLANWEDPARLNYESWSPNTNADYRAHQEQRLNANTNALGPIFLEFGTLGIAVLAGLACFVFRRPWDRSWFTETWRWGWLPVVASVLAFLPFVITEYDTRFFYVAYPLLIVAALGAIEWLPDRFGWTGFPRIFAAALAACLFAFPNIPRLAAALEGMPNPGGYASLELADRMRRIQLTGRIAGDGMLFGSRTGLYVACLLNQPWYGDDPNVVGTDYLSSGAEYIIVHRQHRVNSDMEFNPAFRDLDTLLFPDKMQAEEFPLRVYQVQVQR